jgi:hypothetical protein
MNILQLFKRRRGRWLAGALVPLLSACTVAPPYHRPETPAPAAF